MRFFENVNWTAKKNVQVTRQGVNQKITIGPSGPNWESKRSEHARVSAPKCSWGSGGVGGRSEFWPPKIGISSLQMNYSPSFIL